MPQIPSDAEVTDVAAGSSCRHDGTHAHLSFADASPFAIGATPVEEATITAVRNAALMLQCGFTSAISFGSTYKIDVALRDAIDAGRIAGPRLLAAGRDLGATASNVDAPGGLSRLPTARGRCVRRCANNARRVSTS
jgi:imidazolonepropionase-like amidohydrolase